MQTRHIRITGRVQGVFFRSFALELALELGVVGTAKNALDGSLEIVAQGEGAVLDKFVRKLKRGPSSAQIEDVEERQFEDEQRFEGFTVIGWLLFLGYIVAVNEPTIIFEDETLLALDKPSGLMVHADGRSAEVTLVDWIRTHYPELEGVGESQVLQNGEEVKRPGIVHRLDRETSGVILVAKTQDMFLHLKEQFQESTIEKEYRAFVVGIVKEDLQTIDRPIGRSAGDFRRWSAQRGAKGKLREAETTIQVLERLRGFTYIAAFPKTGRTHQIRVHLKSIHHPVLCDPLYGFKDTPCPPTLSRLALHAHSITFTNLDGERRTAASPVPQEFVAFIGG